MDLTRENIRNLTNLWSLAGRANGQFYSNDDYAISTVAASEWPNKLWFHQPPSRKKLEEILDRTNIAGFTIPVWQTNVTEKLLLSQNFILKNELTGMSIQLKNNHYHTNELSFQKVTDTGTAALWSSLFIKAFGYCISPETVVLTMNRVDYLIGYHGSQSIGTAVLFRDTPNLAGIHSIGVVPDHRRKGYAADLLNHVLNLAKQQGAIYATLQASQMAKGLYLKTGFREDFLLKNFVKH